MLYLGAGLAASKNWRFKGNILPWALVVVSIAAIFTTGSRATSYAAVISSPLVLYVWASRGIVSIGNMIKISFAGMFIAIIVTSMASSAIEAYSYRAEHSDDPIDRLLA